MPKVYNWQLGRAMDYPYEYVADEVTAQDNLPVDAAALKAFFQTNAERVFDL